MLNSSFCPIQASAPSLQRTYFNISSTGSKLLSIFVCLRNAFFLLFEAIFAGHSILGWCFISLYTLNISLHFLLAHMVSEEKLATILIFAPL